MNEDNPFFSPMLSMASEYLTSLQVQLGASGNYGWMSSRTSNLTQRGGVTNENSASETSQGEKKPRELNARDFVSRSEVFSFERRTFVTSTIGPAYQSFHCGNDKTTPSVQEIKKIGQLEKPLLIDCPKQVKGNLGMSTIEQSERRTFATSTIVPAYQSLHRGNEEAMQSVQEVKQIGQLEKPLLIDYPKQGRGNSEMSTKEQRNGTYGCHSKSLMVPKDRRRQMDWTLASKMGVGAFAFWGVLIKFLIKYQYGGGEFGSASYDPGRVQDLESLLVNTEDRPLLSEVVQNLLISKHQGADMASNATDSNAEDIKTRVQYLESRLEALEDYYYWKNLTQTIYKTLHCDEESGKSKVARVDEMESRLETLEYSTRTGAINLYTPAEHFYTAENDSFGYQNLNSHSRSVMVPPGAFLLHLVLFFIGAYVFRKLRNAAASNKINELELKLAKAIHQSDVAATANQNQVNELETQLQTLTRERDAAALNSQARIHDLEMQLAVLTRQTCLSSFARQAYYAWQDYFGDVGTVPNLRTNIDDILNNACPFWPGKRVRDTHILVLVPASVNGHPFTLNLLGELIKAPREKGHRTEYRSYYDIVREELGDKMISEEGSYWMLITRDVLEGSCDKTYAEQRAMLSQYEHLGYEIPSVLEAATAILLHHVHNGEKLLHADDPVTYTRCRDMVGHENNIARVGCFASSGLTLSYHIPQQGFSDMGVLVCRKL